MRRNLLGWLAIVFSLGLPVGSFGAQEEKVIISYSSRDYAALPAHVAVTRGFLREEGLEPIMVQMRPPVAAPALMNAEIHYTTTFGSMLNAIMQGVPAKLLAVITEKPPYYIVARPGIKSVIELRGKKIGMSPPGSAIPRSRARRSTNCRATTSSIVLEALLSSMPCARFNNASTSWLLVLRSSATL